MSETTSRNEPAMHASPPSDVLMTLLINLLAPMFLCGSGGNVEFARLAARETVEAYRISSRMDLLTVAQIVAFGLAALGSLSLSMVDGIGLPLMLRLRGNAASLNRAAEQNRRALERSQAAVSSAVEPYDEAYEAEVLESLRRTEIMAAQARAEVAGQAAGIAVADAPVAGSIAAAAKPAVAADPVPSPDPAGPASASMPASPSMPVPAAADAWSQTVTAAKAGAPDPIATAAEQAYRTMFATAMTEVAGEYATDLSKQPPAQRRESSIRAAALRSSATALLAGGEPPPFTFRLRDTVRPPSAA